jgi:hypothetical protein
VTGEIGGNKLGTGEAGMKKGVTGDYPQPLVFIGAEGGIGTPMSLRPTDPEF